MAYEGDGGPQGSDFFFFVLAFWYGTIGPLNEMSFGST